LRRYDLIESLPTFIGYSSDTYVDGVRYTRIRMNYLEKKTVWRI